MARTSSTVRAALVVAEAITLASCGGSVHGATTGGPWHQRLIDVTVAKGCEATSGEPQRARLGGQAGAALMDVQGAEG